MVVILVSVLASSNCLQTTVPVVDWTQQAHGSCCTAARFVFFFFPFLCLSQLSLKNVCRLGCNEQCSWPWQFRGGSHHSEIFRTILTFLWFISCDPQQEAPLQIYFTAPFQLHWLLLKNTTLRDIQVWIPSGPRDAGTASGLKNYGNSYAAKTSVDMTWSWYFNSLKRSAGLMIRVFRMCSLLLESACTCTTMWSYPLIEGGIIGPVKGALWLSVHVKTLN